MDEFGYFFRVINLEFEFKPAPTSLEPNITKENQILGWLLTDLSAKDNHKESNSRLITDFKIYHDKREFEKND